MTNEPMLAAIPFAQDAAVDALLEDVARALRGRGVRVSGFLQRAETVDGQCCGAVDMEDIESGDRYRIMQPLGRHARGCRLDPHAMAEVSSRAMLWLDHRPEIVILNRFGKGESEGGGLRAVFEAAALRGIPILTSVKESYLQDWENFASGLSLRLAADQRQVLTWCLAAVRTSAATVTTAA